MYFDPTFKPVPIVIQAISDTEAFHPNTNVIQAIKRTRELSASVLGADWRLLRSKTEVQAHLPWLFARAHVAVLKHGHNQSAVDDFGSALVGVHGPVSHEFAARWVDYVAAGMADLQNESKEVSVTDIAAMMDLDPDDWEAVVRSVEKEGPEEWEAYIPNVMCAIRMGYMDGFLQQLARIARERWYSVHGMQQPAAAGTTYTPPPTPGTVEVDMTELLGQSGNVVPMVRRGVGDGAILRSEFRAFGNAYRKSDFIGKFYRFDWKSKGLDVIVKVVEVKRTNYTVEIVKFFSGQGGYSIGNRISCRFDFNRRLFEQ